MGCLFFTVAGVEVAGVFTPPRLLVLRKLDRLNLFVAIAKGMRIDDL